MSSRFYFASPNGSNSDINEDDDSLPFPKPLERSAFLAADFEPAAFLSSLTDRFQTLEDLQNELRDLVQSLNKELVDLVNENYQDFISLGTSLAGGEEKVEEIRVGLLGFQRDVEDVKGKVDRRRDEIASLLLERKQLRKELGKGRTLLEYSERLEDLEHRLRLSKPATLSVPPSEELDDEQQQAWSEDWNDDVYNDSEDEYDDSGVSRPLKHAVEQYLILRVLQSRFDPQHPFFVAQRERVSRIYETLRRDLEATIKQENEVKVKQRIIQLRSTLDE